VEARGGRETITTRISSRGLVRRRRRRTWEAA
jgi:hypothetical protein